LISYNPLSIGSYERLQHNDLFEEADVDFRSTPEVISNYIWSPIIWQDGEKRRVNFVRARLCALDFENPDISIRSAKQLFDGYQCIIGTTRNHGKTKGSKEPCDRFRVVLKFERPVTSIREYEWNMKHITTLFGADQECFDGARCFLPCNEIVHVNLYGDFMQILPTPPEPIPGFQRQWKALKERSRFTKKWLHKEIPYTQRANIPYALGVDFRRLDIPLIEALETFTASVPYRAADESMSADMINNFELGYLSDKG
jgi:hypothetical protein